MAKKTLPWVKILGIFQLTSQKQEFFTGLNFLTGNLGNFILGVNFNFLFSLGPPQGNRSGFFTPLIFYWVLGPGYLNFPLGWIFPLWGDGFFHTTSFKVPGVSFKPFFPGGCPEGFLSPHEEFFLGFVSANGPSGVFFFTRGLIVGGGPLWIFVWLVFLKPGDTPPRFFGAAGRIRFVFFGVFSLFFGFGRNTNF